MVSPPTAAAGDSRSGTFSLSVVHRLGAARTGFQAPFRRGTCAASSLIDHLIRPQQHRLRNRETESLRGLEVDYQFKLRRVLDGEITWAGSSENLVDIPCGVPKSFGE